MNKNDKIHNEDSNEEEIIETELPEQTQDSVSAKEIENLKQQVEESENKYKRAIADYQNLQKRSQEDRLEWIRTANKDLLLRILTVFDTLVLAYRHLEDKNLQVSINHFLDTLKSEGVTKIETVGKEFDPTIMEAITTEKGEEGMVVAEIRAGFMLYDKLLRAAQVTVGKKD
jgi:molecular chaperone GrpE